MINERSLLAVTLLTLTLIFGCEMVQSSTPVEIPTAQTPKDEALSKSVLNRLVADKKADLTGVTVVSNNRRVYLIGTVSSLDARDQAKKIAWEAPGVESVVNVLQVQK